ncbi:MAG: PAS domain S-box protein [Geobacter sp.]|nr:PAS domain S-box protein [Geobacter sp.]
MQWFFSASVRTQLLLITLIIALPVMMMIGYSGLKQRAHAVEDAFNLTRLLSERMAAEQRQIAASAENLLVALAQLPEVRNRDSVRTTRLLKQINQLNRQVVNILVADRSGTVWAGVAVPPNASISDRRYFKNSLEQGRFASGEYVISKGLGVPVFHFAYPYRDASGTVGGVVVLALQLDTFSQILKNSPLPPETRFLLLDHAGKILTQGGTPNLSPGMVCSPDLFLKMQAGPDVGSEQAISLYGEHRFATYHKIRMSGESEPYLYIRVGIPVQAALQASNREIARNISLFLVLLASSLLLANRIGTRAIVQPVRALKQASERLAQGDATARVGDVAAGGELGELARSFDNMADQLTEREAALHEHKAQLRAITDSARDAILMMDAGGLISYWNPAAQQMLGYSSDEALGRNLHQLLAPETFRSAYQPALQQFARTGTGNVIGTMVELRAVRKDGRQITVSLSLSAVQLQGNWHAVGILRDVTEEKLQQEELINARHAAEAANRAKSEFLANMSHEIRTPLNGVIGMAQLLQYTQPNTEQQEYLHYLDLSAKNLLALLNDILDLSKIEAGKIELEQSLFAIRTSIQEVVGNQENRISQKGLQLTTTIHQQVPEVIQGDCLRFKQILMNLLGNAVKFTENGSISITLSPVAMTSSRCTLLLQVCDTGIGMSPEVLERIFLPFEQADNSTTRAFGGSGLGLTICRRLAEQMGGRIWAESTPQKGSCFCVELPFAVADIDMGAGEDTADGAAELPEAHKSLNVLIAEDNDLNAATLVALLKRLGHEATVVTNGQEAIEAWNGSAYACILMDIAMPVMDGCQALAALREQETKMGGHTPVIALTAHALQGDRERFLALGFDGYVAKPVQISELAEQLSRAVA